VISTVRESRLIVMKFRITGNLRFLSHAETVRVFYRACFRAGIKVEHSRGFNPRAKISLPLPRSVAVETDVDLLCFRVQMSQLTGAGAEAEAERLMSMLQEQLPDGCELLRADEEDAKVSFEPRQVRYIVPVSGESEEGISRRIAGVMACESLEVHRRKDARGRTKIVDVRPFMKSMEIQGHDIIVECAYSSAGSIRVDEILQLLAVGADEIRGPVRRTNVQWYKKN